jgi:hypothetical protein
VKSESIRTDLSGWAVTMEGTVRASLSPRYLSFWARGRVFGQEAGFLGKKKFLGKAGQNVHRCCISAGLEPK